MNSADKYAIVKSMKLVHKIFYPCVIFLMSFLPLSCAISSEESSESEKVVTLRDEASSLESKVYWEKELEGDRLLRKIDKLDFVSTRLSLSPLVLSARTFQEGEKVYPVLDGFSSLDTSLIPQALNVMLKSFCERISRNEDADSFISKDCLYTLVLFYSDFERIFGGEKIIFDNYAIGEPFLDGVHYEVPLKFFGKKANLTICAYCFEKSGSWSIDQILITDWEIF